MTIYPEIILKKKDNLNWEVADDCLLTEYSILIEKGFQTDLVSSSRIFWSIIPPHGIASNPAIVHDYIWRNSIFNRSICDKIFLELLKSAKIPMWQCYLMYVIVRLFGWLKNNKIK